MSTLFVHQNFCFTRSVSRVSSLSPTPTPPPDMRETTAWKVCQILDDLPHQRIKDSPSENYIFQLGMRLRSTCILGLSSTYSWQGGNEVSLPRPGLGAFTWRKDTGTAGLLCDKTCCRWSHISGCRTSPKAWAGNVIFVAMESNDISYSYIV